MNINKIKKYADSEFTGYTIANISYYENKKMKQKTEKKVEIL